VNESIDRRSFLGGAAAGLTATTLAGLGPASACGAGERVHVAIVGTNGRGRALAKGFGGLKEVRVVYVCDVDARAIDKGKKAVVDVGEPAPEGVKDFRRTLDDKSVDALVVATPNHWHAPASILACAAGKHVYVEKPCSHNAREGELLVEAARKHRRVVQMGNQRRTWEKIVEAIERVRSGVLGRTYYSTNWYANSRGAIGRGSTAAVPGWLDFDLWQGPAARRDFVGNLVHYNWHWRWHWGNGEIGNNGVHGLDLCRWGLEVDYPIRVTSGGGRYRFDDDQETPDTQVATFEFEGGKAIKFEGMSCNRHGLGGGGFGVSFHGEKGTLVIQGSGYRIHDASDKLIEEVEGPRDDRLHYRNFLECISSGERPASDIEGGHRSTLLCHLGNIAQRTGRSLTCDAKSGRILEDPGAMKLWSREYAKGWEPKV